MRVERAGERLLVTLSRPHVHNAFSAQMQMFLEQFDRPLDGLIAELVRLPPQAGV